MLTETGFLLSYIKYGDHDAVVHVYTREGGYRSCFIRGIFSPKSRKRPYLFPLRELCLTASARQRSGLLSISKLELCDDRNLVFNVKAGAVLFFVADILNQLLKNDEANQRFYEEIAAFLDQLENGNYSSHFVFMFKVLSSAGILPLLSSGRFLDPESGQYGAEMSHQLFDADMSDIFRNVIDHHSPYELRFDSSQKAKMLDALMLYFALHIPDFKIPKSLEVVQQIFD